MSNTEKNKLRILRQAHRHVWNMMMIGDYARAAEFNDKLTSIINAWKCQKANAKQIDERMLAKCRRTVAIKNLAVV